MRAWHRSEREALPRTGGAFNGNGDQPLAKDRLRSRGGNCKGKRENRTNGSRDCTGQKDFTRRRTRARTGSYQNDRAGWNRRGVIASWLRNLKGRSFQAARISRLSVQAILTSRPLRFIATHWDCL